MGKSKAQEMLFWTKEEYEKFAESIKSKPASYYAFEILYWCGIREAVNSTGVIYKDDIESIKKALQGELLFLSEFREKVSDYIINEIIG